MVAGVGRALQHALELADETGWSDFADLIRLRLEARDRAALGLAALMGLDGSEAEATARHALRAAGAPLPPFLGGMEEARQWAGWASTAERKAFCLAAFEALGPEDRAAFLNHVNRRAAA